jgi:glycoprotein endo-alpha-1,2-mannosidase
LVGRVRDLNGAEIYAKIMLKDDMEWCKQRNIEFMPVIYPGFSWHNLQASGENP